MDKQYNNQSPTSGEPERLSQTGAGHANDERSLIPPGSEVPGFERLCRIVAQLRSPQGCPWDREQTPESLRAALIEEVYEAVEAINSHDKDHIREELGDTFLILTMIAQLYQEAGAISIEEILHGVSEKLIRRHPHVFSNSSAANSGEVAQQWDEIKEKIEGRVKDSVLDEVSHALPPLERAFRLQKKAAKQGFDWNEAEPVWNKIAEELEETRAAWSQLHITSNNGRLTSAELEHLEEELGDLLFSVVNVARYLKIDPAVALHRSNSKFDQRFRYVEKAMQQRGETMQPSCFELMDQLWEESKRRLGSAD